MHNARRTATWLRTTTRTALSLAALALLSAFDAASADTITVSQELFGSATPPQQVGGIVYNGDFRIQPNSNEPNSIVGDGGSESTWWTFDLTTDPNWSSFPLDTQIVSAYLTLTLHPKGPGIGTDRAAMEGWPWITSQIQFLPPEGAHTITISLLPTIGYDSAALLSALNSGNGQLGEWLYGDDAIVAYARLDVTAELPLPAPEPATIAPKELLVYGNYPRGINGAGTVDAAASELGRYDVLVLGGGHELPTHWDYANTAAILAHPDLDSTQVFGEVSIAVNVINHSMAEIESRIDHWKALGAAGIFLNHYGYNWGADRDRQNAAVDYAHSQGLPVLAEAFFPADAFGNAVDPVHNPGGVATHLDSTDFYYYDAHQVAGGAVYEGFIWQDKANQVQAYRDSLGFGVFSYTTNADTDAYDEVAFHYSWFSALLYGHDATGWGEFANSAWGASANQAPYRSRPEVVPGREFTSVTLSPEPGVYRRHTDLGVIEVDTGTHTGRFLDAASSLPEWSLLDDARLEEGSIRHLHVEATDLDGTVPVISVGTLPGFVTFANHDDGSGLLTVSPGAGDAGSYTIELVAADALNPAATATDTVRLQIEPADLRPEELLIFSAYPRSINGTGTVDAAAAELGRYDILVLSAGHELPDHWDYANTAAILEHAALDSTTLFGEVSVGVSVVSHSLEEIQTRIDHWKSLGAEGVFLNHFGYNWGTDRARQNAAIDYAHSRNLRVLAEAFFPENAFDPADGPVHLGPDDAYLYDGHQVANGQIYQAFIWQDKANQLQAYQDSLGFAIYSYTTSSETSTYDEAAFHYAWHSALLYGHEATGWGEYAFSGWGPMAEQAPYRQRPVVAPGTAFTGAIAQPRDSHYTRPTDAGVAWVDVASISGGVSLHAPTALTDSYDLVEDGFLQVGADSGLLTNDADGDGDVLTAALVATPEHGQVALTADGSFAYAPNPDYVGSDSFTYEAVDVAGQHSASTVVTLSIAAGDGPEPESLTPASLLVYYGWPSAVNGANTIAEAATTFGTYDYIVFAGLQPDHPDYANLVAILAHPALIGTTTFGYITIGAGEGRTNHPMSEIHHRMDVLKAAGFDGIFLDEFDFGGVYLEEPGVTRQRQNEAIEYAHEIDLPVIANAFFPASVFSDTVDAMHNAAGDTTLLGAQDFYFYESHQVRLGDLVDEVYWRAKADQLRAYGERYDFGILSMTTANETTGDFDADLWNYAWFSALLHGHAATGWGEAWCAASGPAANQVNVRLAPEVDPGTVFTSEVTTPSPGLHVRTTDLGAVVIDASAHTGAFLGAASSLPQWEPVSDLQLVAGDSLELTLRASDLDGTLPVLSAAGLPDFAAFVNHGDGTGTLVLTPVDGDTGDHSLQLDAADATDPSQVVSLSVALTVTAATVAPRDLLVYHGVPYLINGATTPQAAATEFSRYPYVVLRSDYEKAGHWGHDGTVSVLDRPELINTTVFGSIPVGDGDVASLRERIADWRDTGANGVCLELFGYQEGATRSTQNALVQHARDLGLRVMVTAANPQEVFGDDVNASHNPAGTPTLLQAGDVFLYEHHQFMFGSTYAGVIWSNKAQLLRSFQDTLGISVMSYTSNDEINTFDEQIFHYSYFSALLFGHEATGWGERCYSGCTDASTDEAPYRARPQIDAGTFFTGPVDTVAAGVYTRTTSTGTITVNTNTFTGSFTVAAARPVASTDAAAIPAEFDLAPNYPNPFNPSTTIRFQLPAPADVQLRVFNLAGQTVRQLVQEDVPAGVHGIRFDAAGLASGIYLYELRAGDWRQVRRMTLAR